MTGGGTSSATAAGFPIPASLQELESAPYNLLPYPADFDDSDESARAESFGALIRHLEAGNRTLASAGIGLFEEEEGEEEGYEEWNDNERMQALYTLVRKSDSLAPAARGRLVGALCGAVAGLCDALESAGGVQSQTQAEGSSQAQAAGSSYVVSQPFRDALACHVYLLFTLMFLAESKEKLGKSLGNAPAGRGKKGGKKGKTTDKGEDLVAIRQKCAAAMAHAAATMSACRSRLWKRGVPDESVVGLPCRIAYQMLESATGGAAGRKASGGDRALEIIAATVDGAPCLLSTVVAALVDLLHTYDHLAPLVAELCTMVDERPSNVLATELLREIGRLDTSTYSDTAAGGKASGIKNVAPFLSELASVRPRVVLSNISLLLPHLDSEPYVLRSAIINSIGSILVRDDQMLLEKPGEKDDEDDGEDITKEQQHVRNMAKTRSALFDILCERARGDITSFTRGAALRVLNDLTEKQSLPLDRLMPVTAIAIDRLQDKTVMVRRCAMQLLTTILENNPFMGMLDPEIYRAKVRELEAYLKANVPEEILKARDAALAEAKKNSEAADEEEEGGEEKEKEEESRDEGGEEEGAEIGDEEAKEEGVEDAGEEAKEDSEEVAEGDKEKAAEAAEMEKNIEEIEAAALAAAIADAEAKVEANEDLSEAEIAFVAKVRGLRFVSTALSFVEAFEAADDSFRMMLGSSNPSDVTEALRFLVKAKHFGLPCAVSGMKRALALMWSNEQSVQEEVLKAFVEVFVGEPGTQGKELLPENQIAQNFIDLAGEATVSELASIEEALGRLVKKEMIPPDVFSILWTMASQAEGKPRASAMTVLSMAASADPKIVDSAYRLQNLYDAGLGDHVEENRDWATARSAALALQRVRRARVDPSSAKYIILDLIAERLVSVARGDWCNDEDVDDTNAWFASAEQAINAIFAISPSPERVSMEILLGHQAAIFGSDEEPSNDAAHSLRLSRFFFVLGHIALKLLVYTEVLSSSVRRANAAKTVKKQEQSATSGQNKEKEDGDAGSKEGSDEDDAIEAELGIAAQAEAETERRVAEISENEIVGRGMIGLFTPMLLRVVANAEGTYSSPVLMRSATLALCKCMCISKSFCEKHLSLLFSVLAKAPNDDQDLRANIVIALGDLAFRFPNEVEPYTPKIYACLRDKSTRVRRHTLMVLTHLILNDMVKVKGNVCEIALCLQDQESGIRDMARLLFHELSKRTNSPIYNLLPDIVSQLSQLHLKQEVFREIMIFLLIFIKKDRQNEMLMEKLIQRFPKCTSINQKADLAYCIAQLKVNDKCVKCLNDNFKLYKDALFDEDVLRNFVTVLTKAKKIAKPETKDAVEELENKLNEHAAAGLENVKASKKAARAKKRAAKRVAKKKEVEEWEGSEEEEENEVEEEAAASDREQDEFEFDGEENRPENQSPPKVADGESKGRGGRTRSRRGRGVLSS